MLDYLSIGIFKPIVRSYHFKDVNIQFILYKNFFFFLFKTINNNRMKNFKKD